MTEETKGTVDGGDTYDEGPGEETSPKVDKGLPTRDRGTTVREDRYTKGQSKRPTNPCRDPTRRVRESPSETRPDSG